MTPSPPPRDLTPLLGSLAVQLERDRRAFLWGSAISVGGNLVLAGLVWRLAAEGALAWLPATIAFLGNVFYALTAEWELRWEAVWRRELPRLEHEAGQAALLSKLVGERGQRVLARALKWVHWSLTLVWLVVLLVAIRRAGVVFGLSQ